MNDDDIRILIVDGYPREDAKFWQSVTSMSDKIHLLQEPNLRDFEKLLEQKWSIFFFGGDLVTENQKLHLRISGIRDFEQNCLFDITTSKFQYKLNQALAIFYSNPVLNLILELERIYTKNSKRTPIFPKIFFSLEKNSLNESDFLRSDEIVRNFLQILLKEYSSKKISSKKDFSLLVLDTWNEFQRQKQINFESLKIYFHDFTELNNNLDDYWRYLFRQKIANKKDLTSNLLTAIDGQSKTIDQMYVPARVVQRPERNRTPAIISAEEGSKLHDVQYRDGTERSDEKFFEEVLKQKNRIAILGQPGSGKTTLLQKIAQWVFEKTEKDIAIWVTLEELEKYDSIKNYLIETMLDLEQFQNKLLAQKFEELINNQRVWLLLDGLDEIATEKPLECLKTKLGRSFTNTKIIVTCRPHIWEAEFNTLPEFNDTIYQTKSFNYDEQIIPFIDNWFQNNSELAKKLKRELDKKEHRRIKDAVKNPFFLALLCFNWQRYSGQFPKTKSSIYKYFVDEIYRVEQTSFEDKKSLDEVLSQLAFESLKNLVSPYRMEKEFVLSLFKNKLELFNKLTSTGLLILVGAAEEDPAKLVYAFYHTTLQEYFAATYVQNNWQVFCSYDENRLENNYLLFQKNWKEVILLWLSLEDVDINVKQAFIQKLIQCKDVYSENNFYGYRAYFLALEGIREFEYSQKQELLDDLKQSAYYTENAFKKGVDKVIAREARKLYIESVPDDLLIIRDLYKFAERQQDEEIQLEILKEILLLDPADQKAQEKIKTIPSSKSLHSSRLEEIDESNNLSKEKLESDAGHRRNYVQPLLNLLKKDTGGEQEVIQLVKTFENDPDLFKIFLWYCIQNLDYSSFRTVVPESINHLKQILPMYNPMPSSHLSQFDQERLQSLETKMAEETQLLSELEEVWSLEENPVSRKKYEKQVSHRKIIIAKFRQEYEELQQKYSTSSPLQLYPVSQQLNIIDRKIDLVLSGNVAIYREVKQTRQALLERYELSERTMIDAIAKQLTPKDLAITQTLVKAVDENQLSEQQMKDMLVLLEQRVPALPSTLPKEKVTEILQDTKMNIKHRLKIGIPIIPGFINYETEVGIEDGMNVTEILNRLFKKLKGN